MHTLRHRSITEFRGCRYCHTENFEDQWAHHRKCAKMPGEVYVKCEKKLAKEEEFAHSIWKAFVERRFEPIFLTKCENFYCEYCNKRRRNATHVIRCKYAPECLREVIKKIYYWKEG